MAAPSMVMVPMQASAFILNESVCDQSLNVKIAPISQPNYTFLRLSNNLILPDILDRHDLTSSSPANVNSRIYDLGQGTPRRQRIGVHLHWSLPRVYRSGISASTTATADQNDRRGEAGYPASSGPMEDTTAPEYRLVPNRYLVIRRLTKASIPSNLPAGHNLRPVEAWVIESDRIRHLEEFDPDADLEVEAAPFIEPAKTSLNDPMAIEGQSEVFLGKRTRVDDFDPIAARQGNKIGLTMLTSSNPLFGDYAPHNCNVFSVVDPFEYRLANGTKAYLSNATADYYVIGWHTNPANDLFTSTAAKDRRAHLDRLDLCFMKLQNATTPGAADWLANADDTRLFCHSALYGVEFDISKPPNTLVGDTAGTSLKNTQPVAVGSSPIDAILAYCRVHSGDAKDDIHSLEEDITKLQTLLIANSDDVDSQIAAVDLINTQNFDQLDGGQFWKYKVTSATGQPTAPNPRQVERIDELNRVQTMLDSAKREARDLQWKLFAYWWCFVSSRQQMLDRDKYAKSIQVIQNRLFTLIGSYDSQGNPVQSSTNRIQELEHMIDQITTGKYDDPTKNEDALPVSNAALPRFNIRKDPTLLFGNIQSPWKDYTAKLPVRLDTQLIPSSPADPEWDSAIDDNLATRLWAKMDLGPDQQQNFDMKFAFSKILLEFKHGRPGIYAASTDLPAGAIMPFHRDDTVVTESRGRDRWQSRQPWFPLFVEWEAVYSHVPAERWMFRDEMNRRYDGVQQTRYTIDGDLRTTPVPRDQRLVSGRVLILPQPSFSLAANVGRIMDSTDIETLKKLGIDETQQKLLKTKIENLEFLSADMSGLRAHLLTLNSGTHIKPTVRVPTGKPKAMGAAVAPAAPAFPSGMAQTLLDLIDAESALTPYANYYDFTDTAPCPMKPVTHGQLMFTSINIIDRFGQAICAVPPARRKYTDEYNNQVSVFPCVGDAFAIDPVGTPTHPNTVIPEPNGDACRSISLPPVINQKSRINAAFVIPNITTGKWRPTDEWENPVWGWLLVNYADHGLQFFTGDGVFYREIRMGGRGGATTDRKWLPFDPPSNADTISKTNTNVAQLDYLIAKIMDRTDTDRVYLQAFFDMINQSIEEASPHAPPEYAQFLPSAIGKPLALVNAGWSLELAEPECLNWSTLSGANPGATLSDGSLDQRHDEPFLLPSPSKTDSSKPASTYSFPMKLGDRYRWFDGLVGCFAANPNGTNKPESNLDLRTMYTYFLNSTMPTNTPTTISDPRKYLSSSAIAPLSPFYLPCTDDALTFTNDRNAQLSVYGLILDPFSPVHVYTEVLPINTLKLPPWTLQSAMEKMTAFFHLGPIVVTADVPPYDATPARKLDGTAYRIQDNDKFVDPKVRIDIPVVGTADWNWLQPYLADIPIPVVLPPIDNTPGNLPSPTTTTTTTTTTVTTTKITTSPGTTGTIGTPGPASKTTATTTTTTATSIKDTRFNAFRITQGQSGQGAGGTDPTAKMPKGPYTAIEGFLQLVEPIVVDETKKS